MAVSNYRNQLVSQLTELRDEFSAKSLWWSVLDDAIKHIRLNPPESISDLASRFKPFTIATKQDAPQKPPLTLEEWCIKRVNGSLGILTAEDVIGLISEYLEIA